MSRKRLETEPGQLLGQLIVSIDAYKYQINYYLHCAHGLLLWTLVFRNKSSSLQAAAPVR
jgi:hypothetical protein